MHCFASRHSTSLLISITRDLTDPSQLCRVTLPPHLRLGNALLQSIASSHQSYRGHPPADAHDMSRDDQQSSTPPSVWHLCRVRRGQRRLEDTHDAALLFEIHFMIGIADPVQSGSQYTVW